MVKPPRPGFHVHVSFAADAKVITTAYCFNLRLIYYVQLGSKRDRIKTTRIIHRVWGYF